MFIWSGCTRFFFLRCNKILLTPRIYPGEGAIISAPSLNLQVRQQKHFLQTRRQAVWQARTAYFLKFSANFGTFCAKGRLCGGGELKHLPHRYQFLHVKCKPDLLVHDDCRIGQKWPAFNNNENDYKYY